MIDSQPCGIVLESAGFALAQVAVQRVAVIRPGTFLEIHANSGTLLVEVVAVRSAGGMFTEGTALFHLDHPGGLARSSEGTFQVAEVHYVATTDGKGNIVDRTPRPIPAGSTVHMLEASRLEGYLGMTSAGVLLGSHAAHPDLDVRLPLDALQSGHVAVLGQTGSGKTNVLRLLLSGLRCQSGKAFIVFDFHNEFDQAEDDVVFIEPPFAFGEADLNYEVIRELLPGLSVAQEDTLAIALEQRPPTSLENLAVTVEGLVGSEATKRVLSRRLRRLDRIGAFGGDRPLSQRVLELTREGRTTIIRLGTVQTELANAFISSVVDMLLRERSRGRTPSATIFVDEAHRLLSTENSRLTARSFRRIAQEGRKFGITIVYATQRPALVDGTILSQSQTLIAMRLTAAEDTRLVSNIVAGVDSRDVASLGVGQGIVSSPKLPGALWVNFEYQAAGPKVVAKAPTTVQQTLIDV